MKKKLFIPLICLTAASITTLSISYADTASSKEKNYTIEETITESETEIESGSDEKHIERCLDSIMKQDYPNFEVILVNDGSTDESGIIIQKYKEKYKNISYIKQENKGVGAARNAGIKVAKGDYISFVDSDDLIMVVIH